MATLSVTITLLVIAGITGSAKGWVQQQLQSRCSCFSDISKSLLAAVDDTLETPAEVYTPATSDRSSRDDSFGLYRPFAEYAWNRLLEVYGSNLQVCSLDDEMSQKETPAHGGDGIVRITIQAATGRNPETSNIQYARYALLETISSGTNGLQSTGIQVLNMVLFPYASSGLPVFGADFVALPGNKHLLLLDAQPMLKSCEDGLSLQATTEQQQQQWQEWYNRHNVATQFPWNSELPEKVLPYISKYALWTRLGGREDVDSGAVSKVDPVTFIQGPVMEAFQDHLDVYLDIVSKHEPSIATSTTTTTTSQLTDYVQYRLDNDPARPMLKRLFGEEFTEKSMETNGYQRYSENTKSCFPGGSEFEAAIRI